MKFFACLFVLAAIACTSSADKADKKEGLVGSTYGAPAPSYAPSYAPPPCPKNYLFSCQPNLAPVPCAQGYSGGASSSGGYAGAYSENIPQYAYPQPQYAYPQYAGMQQY